MGSSLLNGIQRGLLTTAAGILMLWSAASAAFTAGSPACTVTAATMTSVEGSATVPSPGGWSLAAPLGYNAGVPLTISLSNTNPGKQFRGILLWATNSANALTGSWTVPSGYAAVAGCSGASLTHATSAAKLQQSFTFAPPPAGTGTITFRAVVTEECGGGGGNCRTAFAFPNGISVVESLYPLTVNRSGDGGGTVIHNPSGINCGSTCTADFAANQPVTLLALPQQYSVFSAWSGCNSTSGDQCTVTMSTPKTVVANFPEAKLDVDGSGTPTRYEAVTDGVLALRYLLGLRGTALTSGALAGGATRNATQIAAHLNARIAGMDVDGDSVVNVTSDGLLILRYMLGLRGSVLVAGANQSVLSISQIEARLATLMPAPAP